jgi:hypothetical protein
MEPSCGMAIYSRTPHWCPAALAHAGKDERRLGEEDHPSTPSLSLSSSLSLAPPRPVTHRQQKVPRTALFWTPERRSVRRACAEEAPFSTEKVVPVCRGSRLSSHQALRVRVHAAHAGHFDGIHDNAFLPAGHFESLPRHGFSLQPTAPSCPLHEHRRHKATRAAA